MLETGWHEDISIEEYHGDKETFSKSSICDFYDLGPVKFSHKRGSDIVIKKRCYDIGTAAHTLILEGDQFEKRIAQDPPTPPKSVLASDGSKRGNAYKKWADDNIKPWDEANAGKILLSHNDMDTVKRMVAAVFENNDARILLTGGKSEITGVFEHETGIRMKFRPDHIPTDAIQVDLKTIDNINRSINDAYKLKYHWSACISTIGAEKLTGKKNEYWIVFVDKHVAAEVAIRRVPEWMIDAAYIEMKHVIEDLSECVKTGEWLSRYSGGVEWLDAPEWVKRKYYVS